jgi:hypothetical protein
VKFLHRHNGARQEAEGALRQTREDAERIKRKEQEAQGLFNRISEIRQRNHIKEAVQKIMEAR